MSRRDFDSYGLQRVPDSIRRDCACKICADGFPNRGALWTQEPIAPPEWRDSISAYITWFAKIRRNCYCTAHAESHVL